MPIRTVGEYLKRWGMTPQKPLKRAYEQSPEAAEIYWGDETGLRSDCQHGRGYSLKGETPVIDIMVNRKSVNMLSAVNNQGKVRFQVFDGSMNTQVLKNFCRRLIQSAKRKVYLILDNLRVHHAKVFKAWLKQHSDQIQVFYLPSYSPELNPDEYLNCDLKAGVHSAKPSRSKQQLKDKVISHMRMLQKKPA